MTNSLSNYLGCIPLSEFKDPPSDQTGCEKEKCPFCKKEIWVSELKRKIRAKGLIAICWFCLFELAKKFDIDPNDIEIIDILKTN